MSKETTQQTFGKVDVKPVFGTHLCLCGNAGVVKLERRDGSAVYCRVCARPTWLQEINA